MKRIVGLNYPQNILLNSDNIITADTPSSDQLMQWPTYEILKSSIDSAVMQQELVIFRVNNG